MQKMLQSLSIALVALVLLLPGEALADRRGGYGRGDHGYRHGADRHGHGYHGGRFNRHQYGHYRHFGHPGFRSPHYGGYRPYGHWSGWGWGWAPGRPRW